MGVDGWVWNVADKDEVGLNKWVENNDEIK
jgi:hypothetical protein